MRAPRIPNNRIPWVAALVMAIPLGALACRYSVRDVGFVNLAERPYTLEVPSGNEDAASLATLRQIADALFRDANVQLSTSPPTDADAANAVDTERDWRLQDPTGGTLNLPGPTGPAAGNRNALWASLQQIIQSPVRESILETTIDSYCVVLIVEGSHEAATEAALKAAQGASDAIHQIQPSMPKPVDGPPRIIRVPLAARESERILLWSLGFALEETEWPQAAVLHGRGRRIGPVLTGGVITQTALQETMSIIGQDCECGLDRSWMQGPVFPLAWTPARQKTAYDTLGFDTENPMVKAEMSRIIARGPGYQGPNAGSEGVEGTPSLNASSQRFDALSLGYSEGALGNESSETPIDPDLDAAIEAEIQALLASVDSPTATVADPDPTPQESGVSNPPLAPRPQPAEEPMATEAADPGTTGRGAKWTRLTIGLIALFSLGGGAWIWRGSNR